MGNDVYTRLQEESIANNRLCTIEAEIITPVLIGGYDSKCYHESLGERESLRATEIKGLWRWWARSLIAATITKTSEKYLTLDTADLFVSKVLGSKENISKYAIVVDPSKVKYEQIIRRHKSYPKYEKTRIELLSMRRDISVEYAIKPGALFKVSIYKTTETKYEEDDFVIWSFIVALLFAGVGGKACSRGFGKVKIRQIKCDHVEELSSLLNELYKSNTANEIKSKLEKIIAKALEKAEEVAKLYRVDQEFKNLDLPIEPLIELTIPEKNLMVIEIPTKRFKNSEDALKAIAHASLKQYHKALKLHKEQNQNLRNLSLEKLPRKLLRKARDISGKDVHTWILGLPRAQEPLIIPNGGKKEEIRQKLEEELKKVKSQLSNIDENKINQLLNIITVKEVKNGKEVEYRVKIPTGYYYLGKRGDQKDLKLRRRSPIRFTIIKTNSGEHYIVIYAFRTYDWKEILSSLIHIGAYYKKASKIVDLKRFLLTPLYNYAKDIDEVFNNMVNNVKEIIKIDNDK